MPDFKNLYIMTTDLENLNLEELILELKKIGASEDRMDRSKEVEAVKSSFYRVLGKLKAEAESEGKNVAETFSSVEENFKTVYTDYKRERAEYNRELEAQRQANLEKKLSLIEQLKDLVENNTDVQASFPRLREIQAQWKETGQVPISEFRNINETYQHQVEKFYDMVQINHELRDLDFKKNLEAKEELCAQAESLAASDDVVGSFNTLQGLHEQWKEIGPVEKDLRDSIWDRFKLATGVINKRYQDHFERLKAGFAENLKAKELLCEKVESIADREDITQASVWNALAKEIEGIQQDWKKIGFTSRKDNQRIYDRFRAACDKFYLKKRDYFLAVKGGMEENIAKKEALIAKAEELKDSDNWKKTTDQFIALQKEWKEVGAVPRKKSEQLWKRFRAACDTFFAARDAASGPENDFYANLKAKKAIIEEVKAYQKKEGVSDQQAKDEFTRRFREIGFVPFKEKDNIAQAFREAIDEKFPPVLGKSDLIRKYNALQQDIVTYENNIGFFSNSRNSEPLVLQMKERIEKAKEELRKIEQQIRSQK